MSTRACEISASSVRRRVGILFLATLSVASSSTMAQSVWNTATGNWNTAGNWNGGVPNAEGATATFGETTTPGNTATVTLQTPVTLSQLTINSGTNYTIAQSASSTGSIVIPASGMTLTVLKARSASPSFVPAPSIISAPITGGTLTKNGPALLTLSGANTFSALNVTEGLIRIASGDAPLGAAGGTLTFSNGGGLRIITADWTSARPIVIGAGGGTLDNAGRTITLTGPLTGSSTFFRTATGTTNLFGDLTGFTGTLSFRGAGVTVLGSTGGAASAVTGVDLAGTLILDNSTTANGNRLSDTAPFISRGGELRLTNAVSGSILTESIGALTLDGSATILTLTAGTSSQTTLQIPSITRSSGATALIRGTSFGSAAASGVAAVTVTSAPAGLTGLNAGATSLPIVPWLVASGNTGSAVNGVGLLTYASGGVRPLATSEYATTFAGVGENVRVTGALDTGAGAVVGGLVVSAGTVTGTGVLSVSTGAVVTTDGTSSISAPLSFGAAEGVLHFMAATTTSNTLSGTAGVTKGGGGTWTITDLGNSSTYVGNTTINQGIVVYGGNIPANGVTPSAFGLGTSPIVLAAGNGNVRLTSSTASVIDRGLVIAGQGSADVLLGSNGAGGAITVNGAIALQREMVIASTVANPVTLNGSISGVGRLADNGDGGLVIVNGSNSFSGGTRMNSNTTWIIGNDNALGTGTVWLTGASGSTVAASGTRVVPNTFSVINNSGSVTFSGDANANLTLSGTFDFGGPTTDMVFNNTNPVIFSGKLTNGRFTKAGSGTMIITGNSNDFTGNASITAGILQIGNNGPDGNIPGFTAVASPAQIIFRRTGTVILPGTITGTGDRYIESGGTVVLSGNTTTTSSGKWFVNNGTLVSGNNNAGGTLGTGEIALAAGTAFVYNRTSNLSLANNFSGSGSINQTGPGTATLTGSLTAFTGNTTVTASILQVNSPLRPVTGSLVVTGAGTAVLAAPSASGSNTVAGEFASINAGVGGVVRVPVTDRTTGGQRVLITGTVAAAGTIDLTNNDMIVRGQTLSSVQSLVSSWWASGARNGPGIQSSLSGIGTGDDVLATLAVVSNDNGSGGTKFSTFDGITVAPTDVLVKYTFLGDTDLNGTVDNTDLNNIITAIRLNLTGWSNGDTNYDGVVNSVDYVNALTAIRFKVGSFGDAAGEPVGSGSIPEPAALGLLLAGLPLMSRRRR